jgi:hypothetical protein
MAMSNVKDLIVLTADPQMQRTVETLLGNRQRALSIPGISFDVQRHPHRDSGCRTASEGILRPLRNEYRKAMTVFDFDGSGARNATASELERQYELAGWEKGQVAFIVIEPELEAWLFGTSYSHLQRAVNWSQSEPINEWLAAMGYMVAGNAKPSDPKGAIEAILKLEKMPLSSDLFAELARRVSLNRCQDRAFQKFRNILRRWFPT